jgi:hypothetical protein
VKVWAGLEAAKLTMKAPVPTLEVSILLIVKAAALEEYEKVSK